MDGLPAILAICGGIAFFMLFAEIFVYKRFIDKELEYENKNKKTK
jgi:hypothetical protein